MVTSHCSDLNISAASTLINLLSRSTACIFHHYRLCLLMLSQRFYLNKSVWGLPAQVLGQRPPSKSLIVFGQSCKRQSVGHSGGCKKAAHKLLTMTDVLWKISASLPPTPSNLSTSVTHPSHPASLLLSWERAARGDPGLLNLLPKTLQINVCAHACVCSCTLAS